MKHTTNDNQDPPTGRRKFLKKAIYSAPVIVSLGALIKPISAKADGTGGPSGPPDFFKRI